MMDCRTNESESRLTTIVTRTVNQHRSPRTGLWILFTKSLFAVMLVFAIASPARSQTVTEVLQYGDVGIPDVFGYVEYEGSLFYGWNFQLYRLDSLDSEPVALSLPTPPEWSPGQPAPSITFAKFDGALFFYLQHVNAQGLFIACPRRTQRHNCCLLVHRHRQSRRGYWASLAAESGCGQIPAPDCSYIISPKTAPAQFRFSYRTA